jgi:hypothetical protein
MGLASCQAQVNMCLVIIIYSMLGHKASFIYYYDF